MSLVSNSRVFLLSLTETPWKRTSQQVFGTSRAHSLVVQRLLPSRLFSGATCVKMASSKPIASFQEVKSAEKDQNVIVIDVREPAELEETGVIPGSINIPLGNVENVLKNTTPEEFKKLYNKEKPKPDFPIIFSCKAGKRGEQAQNIACELGYKDVKNFGGGWLEWEKNIQDT